MAYLKLKHEDIEIELTPEVIRDFKAQLISQVKDMPLSELIETIQALGIGHKSLFELTPKDVVNVFKSKK